MADQPADPAAAAAAAAAANNAVAGIPAIDNLNALQLEILRQRLNVGRPLDEPRRGTLVACPILRTTEVKAWRTFNKAFRIAVDNNRWVNDTAKNQLIAALQDQAAILGRRLDKGDNNVTWQQLMEQLQNQFITPQAADAADDLFRASRQDIDEPVRDWHTRVVDLFGDAHPNLTAAEVNNDRRPIRHFIIHLNSREVSNVVMSMNSPTLDAVLINAVNTVADIAKRGDGEGAGQKRVLTIDSREGEEQVSKVQRTSGRPCSFCGRTGHQADDCWSFQRARTQARIRGGPRGRGASRGNRGNRGFPRGRRPPRPPFGNRAAGSNGGAEQVHHLDASEYDLYNTGNTPPLN